MKRHLSTKSGMTPADYRARWGLPSRLPDGRAELRGVAV